MAFSGCDSLESIYYQGDIASWCGISGLDKLMEPGRTLYINGEELSGELVIPDGVTAIPAMAFYCCDLITSVTISDDVTEIGSSAFYGCSSIESVTIGNGVTVIPVMAFHGCGLITSIIIPDSVTFIGDYAFNGCGSLDVVFYGGTESDWGNMDIGSRNAYLTDATRYYYSENQPTEEGNFWHYDTTGVTPVIWTKETT